MVGERLHSLPLLTFIAQPPVLFFWITGSVPTWLVLLAEPGAFGFYLAACLWGVFAILFFNYGLDVIEYTARGHASAPPLSEALTGSRLRLLRECVAILIAATLVEWTPGGFRWLTISILLAIAPAVSSSIVFHEPLISALNPKRIYQFMSNMGFGYLALRIITTSVLLLSLYVASRELPVARTEAGQMVISLGAVMAVLMMFRATGALLHVYREKLGIRTEFSEEQAEAAIAQQHRDEAQRKFEEIRLVFKTSGTKAALALLERELKRHQYRDDPVYFELLDNMSDRRLLYRFSSGYIDRMLEGQVRHAWALFLRLAEESRGEFRLLSGATLFKLSVTAEKREERARLLELFERFEVDFPQHPKTREAALQAANLALLLSEVNRAKYHFARVEVLGGEVDRHLYTQLASQLQD